MDYLKSNGQVVYKIFSSFDESQNQNNSRVYIDTGENFMRAKFTPIVMEVQEEPKIDKKPQTTPYKVRT